MTTCGFTCLHALSRRRAEKLAGVKPAVPLVEEIARTVLGFSHPANLRRHKADLHNV